MNNHKNILIVSDCPTHRNIAGNRNCILQNVRLLKEIGHSVYFLLLDKGDLCNEDIIETSDFWGPDLLIFKQNRIQTLIQHFLLKLTLLFHCNNPFIDFLCPWGASSLLKTAEKQWAIDSIIVNYVWNSKLLTYSISNTKCLFSHDVFSNRNQDGLSAWHSFSSKSEAKALRRADHILSIQENESIFFRHLVPSLDVHTVYMPFSFKDVTSISLNNLLFFSGYNEHNQSAIKSFINNIWPVISAHFPELKLFIGGSICKVLQDLPLPETVVLKGMYKNPEDFYSQGAIVINPVSSGTGLKVKTFEAISYGKYVLVHPHSVEGIFEKQNAPIVVCNSADDYINALDKTVLHLGFDKEIRFSCLQYIERLNNYIKNQYCQVL